MSKNTIIRNKNSFNLPNIYSLWSLIGPNGKIMGVVCREKTRRIYNYNAKSQVIADNYNYKIR